jgi:putative ABC transport system permease protein
MSWRRFFRRNRADAEAAQEMESYLAEETAENIARGMSPEEARRQAHLRLGNPVRVRETLRQQNTLMWMSNLWRDLRYSARSLSRTPGFALVAILVMALGIGANIALFTVVHSMLLKPLPYRDSNHLVMLYQKSAGNQPQFTPYLPVDAGSFQEWKQATHGMADLAMVSPWQNYNVSAEGGKLPERIDAAWCSSNFFSALGVQPALGRDFSAGDDRSDAPATAILSHSFWKRRYASDPSIIGRNIILDGNKVTVIGVLPASFVYSSSFGGNTVQVWTPVHHEAPAYLMATYEDHEFLVIARLAHGVTLQNVLDRLGPVQKQILLAHPKPSVHDAVSGRSMLDDTVQDYKTPLYALLAATGCVLLIACMNVASLLIARTAARKKELAIRAALGGGRLRLMSERIVESLLLSIAGGGLGLLLAWGALRWLVHTRQDMNRIEAIHIDGVVVAFTLGILLLCTIFSGLMSALSSGKSNILSALQDSGRGHSAGIGRARLRRLLLVLEIGLTVMLLIGAGLLLKSFQRLRSTDIGVPVDNVLTMQVSLPQARYSKPQQKVEFFQQLIERVRVIPGVQSAALISKAPGEGWGGDHGFVVAEHPPMDRAQVPDMMVRGADPGYFAAVGLPILRGRTFNDNEKLDRANVVLISKSAADLLFHGEDPIGRHLQDQILHGKYEIVGVVGDTRWSVDQPIVPTVYWSIFGNYYTEATIVVRAPHDVESLALPVQKVVGQLDPDLPVSDVMTLRQAIGKTTINAQFDSILILGFAGIALLLAAAGLYGVLAYLVAQRSSEIGIRIALGARRMQMLRMVLIDGLWPAIFGLALGLVASAATTRLIRSMLYATEPLDPAVFAAVAGALLLVAALACIIPAWRASRLDPMQTLRSE